MHSTLPAAAIAYASGACLRLPMVEGTVSLRAANVTFPPMVLKEAQTLTICGVVTYVVKKMRK